VGWGACDLRGRRRSEAEYGDRAGRREFRGGLVAKAAVGPDLVVLVAPSLREVSRLGEARELFEVEQLVTQLSVEGLDVRVLKWSGPRSQSRLRIG
jgi:hypothetical protein